jgi:MFS family permease
VIRLGQAPLQRNSGTAMFACVAIFGIATIVFGLSQNFTLSVAMLILLGGADMVSVHVRRTVLQLATPDYMRGRVRAIDRLFIGASNQLGGFESGVTAQWFGTVPSVVVGVSGLWQVGIRWWLFPELRALEDLNDVYPNAK